MSRGLFLLAGIALALPAPAVLADDAGEADATRRLRACLASGIDGAPRDSLVSSVVAVRALCGHQINVVRRARYRDIERDNAGAHGGDSAVIDQMKADSDRRLDSEIAGMVSRLTGLDG